MFFKILKKDFKIFLSDPTTWSILILMPIILSSILSLALQGSFSSDVRQRPIQIAIVRSYDKEKESLLLKEELEKIMKQNEDEKDEFGSLDPEKIFFESFLNQKEIRALLQYRLMDEKGAKEALKKNEIYSILYLPPGFYYDFGINMMTPYRNKILLSFEENPEYQIRNQMVKGIIQGFFDEMSSLSAAKNRIIAEAIKQGKMERAMKELPKLYEKAQAGPKEAFPIIEKSITRDKPITSVQYYTIGMLSMFMMFAAGAQSYELLKEKRGQTYQRQIVAGTSFHQILMGRFCASVLFLLIQQGLLFLFSTLIFKSQFGNFQGLLLCLFISALSMASLSALLTVISFTAENYAVNQMFQNIFIYILALLGGSYIPLDVMPAVVQKIGPFVLNGAILKIFLQNAAGAPLKEMTPYLVGILVQSLIFVGAAFGILKWRRGISDV